MPLPALSRPPLLLQVYPEPRTESECLSNIREFLRGCGASLRLEVSRGWGRAAPSGARRGVIGLRGCPARSPALEGVCSRSPAPQEVVVLSLYG